MAEIMLCLALISFKYLFDVSIAGDTMFPNQPLKDIGQNLVSAGGMFELGFFSPGNSSNRYIGIWYTDKPSKQVQVVWVANREAPINSSTAILHLGLDGNLNLLSNEKTIWSTNTSGASVLQLLDTGNLVLSDSERWIWQSFDHPSHALLAGMKLGRDFRTNNEWVLTSWKSDSDPSPGAYSYRVYSDGPPEVYVAKGSVCIWRGGTWTGHSWDELQQMTIDNLFNPQLVSKQDELYYIVEIKNNSIASPVVLNPDGTIARWMWVEGEWSTYWKLPADVCDTYAICGVNGVCRTDGSQTANCSCLGGFEPRSEAEWRRHEWSGGCMRREALGCEKGDGFLKVGQLKLPDTRNVSSDSSKGIHGCREWCLQDCSCQAYAVITEESRCIVWFEILIDIRELTQGGEDLYVRVAASEIAGFHHRKRSVMIIASAVFSSMFVLFISLCVLFLVRRRKGKLSPKQFENGANQDLEVNGYDEQSDDIMKDQGLPLFTFSTITSSTNNFSDENKIGEGGYGPVYKGILSPNGQEIAVKRLSKGSGQGVDEFKNEIKLIANLQHKNLVKLLGCCIKDEERILVYEYMPNRSLNHFLFDPIRAASLDWTTRVRVIHGVAQGLLYLHKYSRLRIIHRDLKSGNILLDSEMNPKISDFGIARIFRGNQDLANTSRIVGTYGYMPPEYVIEGRFSEKSDVFSFGVLLLEIVSGKRNCGAPQVGDFRFLTGYVWRLWEVGRISEMMDPVLHKSCPLQDLIRYVHVGLLCVQEEASERPTMSTVISFLSSELPKLPKPKGVGFFTQRRENEDFALLVEDFCSSNELTITAPDPR